MQTDTTPAQFKGFFAIVTDSAGKRSAVKVINEGTAKTPEGVVEVWKIRPVLYSGSVGWSGGCRAVYRLGAIQWVRKSITTGSWATDRGALKAI